MPTADRCPNCFAESSAEPCPHCGWRPGLPTPAPYLLVGTLLDGRYRIGRVLGHGGFGITYLGWDDNLALKLAIKEYLPRDFATRTGDGASVSVYTGEARHWYQHGLERFQEEARTLAKFQQHPGIVSVYNFFRANATGYMVMEYVEGITLKAYLAQQGTLPYESARKALLPVMDALRAVHAEGLLHRDVAPDNIYITHHKQVKLLDFGAARFATSGHSRSLSVILKPGYAPEEQYRSKGQQGPWTDVYGLAATLYHSLTGEVPPEALDRLEEDTLRRPSALGIGIPPAAEDMLMAGLAVRAADRPQSMEAFQQPFLPAGAVAVGTSALAPKPGAPAALAAIPAQTSGRKALFVGWAMAAATVLGSVLVYDQYRRQSEVADVPASPAVKPGARVEVVSPSTAESAAKAEAEARIRAEEEARIKAEAEAEARVRAEEARTKSEAEAGVRAEAEAALKRAIDSIAQGMVTIPRGSFQMGCSLGDGECYAHEKPAHQVQIRAFRMGKYEVTRTQWRAVMGENPSSFKGDDHPVEYVSWNDIQEFLKRLNASNPGKPFRLPTEAEWEYAARAGTKTPYWWGKDIGKGNANCAGCGSRWDGDETAPVGSFRPNAFGLYDTASNVWEWVQDCWHGDYQGAPADGSEWRDNCQDTRRVRRGGAWGTLPGALRVSARRGDDPADRDDRYGLRLAQDLETAAEAAATTKADEEAKARAEAEAKAAAAAQVKAEQEAKAKAEAEARMKTEAQAKAEAGRKQDVDSIAQGMVKIPGGSFQMGCSLGDGECYAHEKPAHQVQIRAFRMGKYEVTQAQWRAVMGENPSSFKGDDHPVENVSWNNIQEFLKRLNASNPGKPFRLPTEAEWEYAARAGTKTPYWWGKDIGKGNAKCFGCGSRWDGEETDPVGSFRPNAFGLYDTAGSVWEWVQDCWHGGYQGAPADGSEWRDNCQDPRRVVRGGARYTSTRYLRVSNRHRNDPADRFDGFGLRLAQDL